MFILLTYAILVPPVGQADDVDESLCAFARANEI